MGIMILEKPKSGWGLAHAFLWKSDPSIQPLMTFQKACSANEWAKLGPTVVFVPKGGRAGQHKRPGRQLKKGSD